MNSEEGQALINRFYDEGWNANNLAVYDELVTEADRTDDLGGRGKEGDDAHRGVGAARGSASGGQARGLRASTSVRAAALYVYQTASIWV